MKERIIYLCLAAILLFSGWETLEAQKVKIKQVNMTRFPDITLTISIENNLGDPIQVNTSGLTLYEEKQHITPASITPMDQLEGQSSQGPPAKETKRLETQLILILSVILAVLLLTLVLTALKKFRR